MATIEWRGFFNDYLDENSSYGFSLVGEGFFVRFNDFVFTNRFGKGNYFISHPKDIRDFYNFLLELSNTNNRSFIKVKYRGFLTYSYEIPFIISSDVEGGFYNIRIDTSYFQLYPKDKSSQQFSKDLEEFIEKFEDIFINE